MDKELTWFFNLLTWHGYPLIVPTEKQKEEASRILVQHEQEEDIVDLIEDENFAILYPAIAEAKQG